MSKSKENAYGPALERLMAEKTRLLSQAQAFAQMGLTETARPLWRSAASLPTFPDSQHPPELVRVKARLPAVAGFPPDAIPISGISLAADIAFTAIAGYNSPKTHGRDGHARNTQRVFGYGGSN